jgi:hypothetical protein
MTNLKEQNELQDRKSGFCEDKKQYLEEGENKVLRNIMYYSVRILGFILP